MSLFSCSQRRFYVSGAIPSTIEQSWLERADGDENLAEGTLRTEDEVIKELYAENSPGLY